jgi:type IV secretory pathway TrbD component
VDFLLLGADRETLVLAVGGLAAAVGCVLTELAPQRQSELRDYFSRWALAAAVQEGT